MGVGHKDKSGKFHPHGKKKSVWEVRLEEPSLESGNTTHRIELGEKANVHDVKMALLRMTLPNGEFRYYDQDVNKPYLHYIKKMVSLPQNYYEPNKKYLGKTQEEIAEDWWNDQSENGALTEIINSANLDSSKFLEELYQYGSIAHADWENEVSESDKQKIINKTSIPEMYEWLVDEGVY